MNLFSFLRWMKTRWTSRSRASRRSAPRIAPARARLDVESPEDRVLLSTASAPLLPRADDAIAKAAVGSVANPADKASSKTTLARARSLDNTHVLLRFRNKVGARSELTSAYTTRGLQILGAKVAPNRRFVVLMTSPQKPVRYV